jgi:ribonuclease-3
METNELQEIENILSYQFQNQELLIQAFTRSSYAKEHDTRDNEVLEFIGDTVLNQIVVSRLIDHYASEDDYGLDSDLDESMLTDYKIKLVNKKILSHRIDVLGLANYLLLGKGDKKNKVAKQDSVKEDLFEAIVGAVAIDSDYNWNELNNLIDVMLDIDTFIDNDFKEAEDNSIGELQNWFQKKGQGVPGYEFHENKYYRDNEWYCYLDFNYRRFDGQAETKIEAKKICAQNVIDWLVENDQFYSIKDEISEISLDKAINNLQELAQKEYFSTPSYEYEENFSEGGVTWTARIDIEEYDFYCTGTASTKKEAKKQAAMRMLEEILELD